MRHCAYIATDATPAPVFGYDSFLKGTPDKRALVCLSLAKLQEALRTQSYNRFNSEGLSFEVIRALNERGFVVDVVDYQDREFVPARHYDLVVTHGNYNACRILEHLKKEVISIAYESGCAQDEFERQTAEKYAAFERAYPKAGQGLTPVRVFDHDDLAAVRSVSAVICLGELTRQTLLRHNPNCYAMNNSAIIPPKRAVQGIPRDFVCVAGSGNVQKGLDLVIAAFSETPEATLYLASVIEPEVLRGMKAQLRARNIHYVHHRRRNCGLFPWLRERCAFTVLCGLNSGQSTALVGCLGEGYIPVVNAESNMGLTEKNSIHITGNTVPEVKAAIRRAMALRDEEIAAMSAAALAHFDSEFSIAAFRRRIHEILAEILKEKVTNS